MLEWNNHSSRKSNDYEAILPENQEYLIDEILRELFNFLNETLIGNGNAIDFDQLMFQVSPETGRVIAAAAIAEQYERGYIDACHVRIQEIQNRYYVFADNEELEDDDEFSRCVKSIEREIGQKFHQILLSHLDELRKQCSEHGFDYIQLESGTDLDAVLLKEHYDPA
ncbi:hypothetical protein [uncultured Gimesia sp.]|uniref:hypothetical protein n=1 Tax=uncultured Gimesia sp. TaxID=1678688 RepID=UPI0026081A87|nr:hypothetical protein [uncultured Gimesia sp.]